VSTRGQVKADISLPFQDKRIREWARQSGHRIAGKYSEGWSGAKGLDERVALADAIEEIEERCAGGLVCYSLDRLTREITVQEAIRCVGGIRLTAKGQPR